MPPLDVRARRVALISVTLLVVVLAIAAALDPLAEGLTATFYPGPNWSSSPARTIVDPRLDVDGLFAGWRGQPPDTFSATWNGAIVVFRPGTYTFATRSDDGSWIYVDGRLVVDNGGEHSARVATGSIQLARGVHAIFVTYFQRGGEFDLDLSWSRDGGLPAPIPAWALTTRTVSFPRMLASVVLRRALRWSLWAWLFVTAAVAVAAAARTVAGDVAAPRVPAVDAALVAIGVVVSFVWLPHVIASDALTRYYALKQLFEWRELSPVAYSMIGPLVSSPLYLLDRAMASAPWWCARFNMIVFAIGLAIAYRLLRDRVDRRALQTFLLVLVGASMFAYHVQGYFAEVFTATLAALGLAAVAIGRPLAGWTAVVVGVANTPAALGGLAAASLWQTCQTRRLRHLAAPIAGAALIGLEAWIRRGSPFTTGYEGNYGASTVLMYSGRPGFSYPFFFGALSILLSFGKGLLFFAPGLLVGVPSNRTGAPDAAAHIHRLWIVFLVGLVLVYAKWWAWYGGLFWGPRFFLFASFPASLALAVGLTSARTARWPRAAALLAVLTLSLWVAIDGGVYRVAAANICREDLNYESLCWYTPEYSALWQPFVDPPMLGRDQIVMAAYYGAVYVWLAAPLAVQLARAARSGIGNVARPPAGAASWRL